jgi:membrane protein implicated in regulation of membrane protease activity
VPVFVRYLIFQLPGWLAAVVVLWAAVFWFGLSAWIAVALVGLLVLKDLLIYPWVRSAYEEGGSGHVGPERLLGALGRTEEALAPSGYVRVAGELWRAEAEGRDTRIEAGQPVRVRDVRGLTLLVDPEEVSRSRGS